MKSLSRVRLFATSWAVACTRLLHPSDFLGKSTGVGCHFLLQGIFLTQGLNPGLTREVLCRRLGFNPWVGKIPWRREWLPTPVFLPGEFHGQRSLEGYSPQDPKESDMTEQLTLSLHFIDSSGLLQNSEILRISGQTIISLKFNSSPNPKIISKGISQVRTLEWVAISISRASSQPRDQTQVSRIAGRFFTVWATTQQLQGVHRH